MPRLGKCPCGATVQIPDAVPPDGVKCAACGRTLRVGAKGASAAPKPASSARAPAASTGKPCPSCGKMVEADALLCVYCGTNFGTGARVETRVEKDAPTGFVRELKDEFVRQFRKWWWVFVGLGILGILVWQI